MYLTYTESIATVEHDKDGWLLYAGYDRLRTYLRSPLPPRSGYCSEKPPYRSGTSQLLRMRVPVRRM
jgi:hypothetical protein